MNKTMKGTISTCMITWGTWDTPIIIASTATYAAEATRSASHALGRLPTQPHGKAGDYRINLY